MSDIRSTDEQFDAAERNAAIMRMLRSGISVARIAEHFNLTRQRIYQIKKELLDQIPVESVGEYRLAMRERLEEQRSRLYEKATAEYPQTAANGKVVREGVPMIVEDEDGNISAVIDHGHGSVVLNPVPNIAAEVALLKVEERLAKLDGLDAAVKIEQSGAVELKYSVVGLNPDNL